MIYKKLIKPIQKNAILSSGGSGDVTKKYVDDQLELKQDKLDVGNNIEINNNIINTTKTLGNLLELLHDDSSSNPFRFTSLNHGIFYSSKLGHNFVNLGDVAYFTISFNSNEIVVKSDLSITKDNSITTKKYVDNQLQTKADKTELTNLETTLNDRIVELNEVSKLAQENKANKLDITTYDTNNEQLTNSINGIVANVSNNTKTIETKQNKLIAGKGIVISENTISTNIEGISKAEVQELIAQAELDDITQEQVEGLIAPQNQRIAQLEQKDIQLQNEINAKVNESQVNAIVEPLKVKVEKNTNDIVKVNQALITYATINFVNTTLEEFKDKLTKEQFLPTHRDIEALKKDKQDKLIAGDNITIVGNRISAIGGGEQDLSSYAKTQYVDTQLATKQDKLTTSTPIQVKSVDLGDNVKITKYSNNEMILYTPYKLSVICESGGKEKGRTGFINGKISNLMLVEVLAANTRVGCNTWNEYKSIMFGGVVDSNGRTLDLDNNDNVSNNLGGWDNYGKSYQNYKTFYRKVIIK